MRKLALTVGLVIALVGALALPAYAPNEKYTFNDVQLTDELTGEIEASVKIQKNKDDSITCSYFTDDYEESLGYYFEFVEPAPLDAETVKQFCLDHFDDRFS